MNEDAAAGFRDVLADLEGDKDIDLEAAASAIEAAARAGDAFAARLAANVAGAGFGRPLDLSAALDWLKLAAAGGDDNARAQLGALAQSGETIDIAAFVAPRTPRALAEQPHIWAVDGFLNVHLCRWLIDRAAPLQEATLVYDGKTGHPMRSDTRTNTAATFKITDQDLPILLIRQRIANTLGVPVEHFERTSVFRYEAGQTFADHVDYISTSFTAEIRRNGQRPYTFLVYLNDAFEGGETHFLKIDRKIRVGPGGALFWRNVDDNGAPDESTHHAGAPPTSGEKWLLSQFVRDKPQLPG